MQLGRRYVTTQAQSQHPHLWDDLRLIICPRIDSQSMDIFRRHSIAGTVPVLEAASGMGTYNGSSIERAWTSDLSHVDDDEFSIVAVAYTDNLGASRALAGYATNSAQSDDRYLLAVSSSGANRLIWQKRNGVSNVQVDALVDGAMTVGEPFCAVGLSTASALDLWLCSGGTVSRGTASSPPSLNGTVNRGEVGRLYNGGSPIIYWDGGVGLFLEYGRRLTDQEAIQLAADPFCLFEPRRRAPVATFVIPAGGSTFTGSGTLSAAAATTSGSGTHTAPVYTGSGTPSAAAATCAGSGTFTAPVYTGSGSPSTAAATASGSGTHSAPGTFTGTGSLSAAAATTAGSGTFTAPVYTGSGAPATAAATCSGSGTYTAPGIFTGSGALAAAAATASGAGTHTAPVYTGSGAPAVAAATASGTGAFWTNLATGALTTAAATCAGVGTHTASVAAVPTVYTPVRCAEGQRVNLRASTGNRVDLRGGP